MVTELARNTINWGCLFREHHLHVLHLCGLAGPVLGLFSVPQLGSTGRGLTLALVLFPLASSDCYIYDSATGYYYDPLAGTYYDPNTQVSFWFVYFISDSFEKSTYNLLV